MNDEVIFEFMNNNIINGPVMIPGKLMIRYHEDLGYFQTSFNQEQIQKLKERYDKGKQRFNMNHSEVLFKSVEIIDSFTISDSNRCKVFEQFKDLPNGTWMITIIVHDDNEYAVITDNGLSGFSVEVNYTILDKNGKSHSMRQPFKLMNKISDILPFNVHVYGGSTWGAGRNEHGDAHFTIKEKNSNKNLGKILMPSLEQWSSMNSSDRKSSITVQDGPQLKNKERKAFSEWLSINNFENLLHCHAEWNRMNEFNHRTNTIV